MKAVVLRVDEEELARRRRLGLDRFDEMWEGVLHMTPAPSNEHQRVVDELIIFLGPLLKRKRRGTLRTQINVFREESGREDYRIPDHTFVAIGREKLLAKDGVRGGGPDAVIDVRSPDDETYEKLPFYLVLGVREVIVVDRDTKKPEIFRLAGPQYVAVAADREGWLPSETLIARFRRRGEQLEVEDAEDPAVRAEI